MNGLPMREVVGVPVHALTMAEAVARCRDAVAAGETLLIGMLNAAKVIKMREDAALRAAVLKCDVILADGMSVVWASRLLRQSLPERVAGIDLFTELLQVASSDKRSVYLLGGTEEVVQGVREVVRTRYPGAVIAGARNGYFDPATSAEVAAAIRQTGADYLFVGMSSPRKELFLAEFGQATGARVLHGVGGSFDVLAGKVRRAPRIWQRLGCEWLFRALQEPRRLMGRYLGTNGRFLWLVVQCAWSKPGRGARPAGAGGHASSTDPDHANGADRRQAT